MLNTVMCKCLSTKNYCLEIQFGPYICRGYDRGGGGRGRGRFNWGSEGGGRGRGGRGGPPERGNWRGGGARGRGSFGYTSSSLSKEDLDSEMDAYMAQTKGGLDKEIDSYMNRFAHSQVIQLRNQIQHSIRNVYHHTCYLPT